MTVIQECSQEQLPLAMTSLGIEQLCQHNGVGTGFQALNTEQTKDIKTGGLRKGSNACGTLNSRCNPYGSGQMQLGSQ